VFSTDVITAKFSQSKLAPMDFISMRQKTLKKLIQQNINHHYFRKREIAIGQPMLDVNQLVARRAVEVTGRSLRWPLSATQQQWLPGKLTRQKSLPQQLRESSLLILLPLLAQV
jgi:hypothetical protein